MQETPLPVFAHELVFVVPGALRHRFAVCAFHEPGPARPRRRGIAVDIDDDVGHEVVVTAVCVRRRAAENGLAAVTSATNFVALDCGGDGDTAMRVLKALEGRGVFVRKPMAPGLDRHIRISVGRPEELDVVADELPIALREAR